MGGKVLQFIDINHFSVEANSYYEVLSDFHNVGSSLDLNKTIIFKEGTLHLENDIWDFRNYNPLEREERHLYYNFYIFPIWIKDYIKKVILKKLIEDNMAPSTVKDTYFIVLQSFSRYLMSIGINSPSLISKRTIECYFESLTRSNKESTKQNYKNVLSSLIVEFENHKVPIGYKGIYKFLNKKNHNLLQHERELGKTDLIPKEYYETMLAIALENLTNSEVKEAYKVEAAIILLLSQIGLRIGELRLLEIYKKQGLFIPGLNETVSILFFKTYKTVENGDFKWTKTFLTFEAEKAYEFLSETAKKNGNERYLFLNSNEKLYTPQKFRSLILRFVVRNKDKLRCVNISENQLNSIEVSKTNEGNYYVPRALIKDLKNEDIIYFPLPHQFRVNMATILYQQGVHIDWIREHMNHLSTDMTLHYIREQKKREQHAIDIKDLIKEEAKKIDLNQVMERKNLYKKIDRFVNKQKFNITVNIEKIIELVQSNKPIREKEYGYCIKSNFGRACPKNIRIDIPESIENHLASCEFLNITYNRFQKMKEIITYNRKNGFTVEAKRETKRLNRLIQNYFKPELNELRLEINMHGISQTLLNYPHLDFITKNIESIENEVEKWLQKN